MSFQPNIEFNTVTDFEAVLKNFEGLASMLGRKLPPTTLFLIPFYSNNDEVVFAATIMGEREYIRNKRGTRDFSNKEILEWPLVHANMVADHFDEVVRNLSNPEMVAYGIDIRTSKVVDVVKLHKDGVPYVNVTRQFLG